MYKVYFDPTETSLLQFHFFDSVDEGQGGKRFSVHVESSAMRDTVALAFRALGCLVHPTDNHRSVFESRVIDTEDDFRTLTSDSVVNSSDVDSLQNNLRINLELLQEVNKHFQRERRLRRRCEMELYISQRRNEEIHSTLQKNAQEISESNDRMEAMEASFKIAEASKQDLMIELDRLNSKLRNEAPESPNSLANERSSSSKSPKAQNDAKAVSISVPSDGQSFEYSQTTPDAEVKHAERVAKLMKDAATTKEELQTELSRKEESELLIKKLKQQMQEEKFQASAAGSRHARALGKLTSTNNLQQREIEKLNRTLEETRATYEKKLKALKEEIDKAKQERSEANAALEVEKRKQLSLIGDLSDYKTQFIELTESIEEVRHRSTKHAKERDEVVKKNDKLTTERNALKRKISTLKKDLLRIAHVDALVAEKQELLLKLSVQKAIASERGDNLKIFQNACVELDKQNRLPAHLKFLLTFCDDDECMQKN